MAIPLDHLTPASRRILGVALVAAPALLLASTVAYLAAGDGINDGVLGGTVGVWSCLAFLVAWPGLMRALEPRAPRAAPVLGLMAVAGFGAGVGFNVQAILTGYYGSEVGELLDDVQGADLVAVLAFLPWGWLAPVTLVATGVLLWRLRAVPRPWAGLLVAGGVLFVASRPERIGWLAVVADLAVLAAVVPLGLAALGIRGATGAARRSGDGAGATPAP